MNISYHIILIGSLLLLASVLATSFSSRIGMPILLAFLALGMLAGEQGFGKIVFQDAQSAHLIGTLALAIILFDAGLHTKTDDSQVGLLPALSLSSIGIMITSLIVGLFAAWLLKLNWLEGLLVGTIIGPTDAAAVVSLLSTSKFRLKSRVVTTLEIESGSNDPIALLLTVSIISLLQTDHPALNFTLIIFFFQEVAIGVIFGVMAGYVTIHLANWIKLAVGLYPLLILSSGMLVFASTELLDGSGYLAVYLAGIVIGNNIAHQRENILRIHDSLAWLSQISVFLMLGLLVTPSALLPNAFSALLIAVILIGIARPIATWISLLPFGFSWREQLFIAWVGLRGAVPIILAINPLLAHLKNAMLYFNIIFFIVIISIILQGWTLSSLAHWLKLEVNKYE